MLKLQGLQDAVRKFWTDNATTILTGAGVAGTAATGVLAWRGGYKACQKHIERENILASEAVTTLNETGDPDAVKTMTKPEKVMLALPDTIPSVLAGGGTIAAIIMAHKMNAQKAAALAALYGLSQKQLEEYKNKIDEKLTGPKSQAVRDEIQQDRVNQNPPPKDVIIIGSGEVLCYDSWSGRYFKSSVEAIRKAENAVHLEILNSNAAPLRTFYDALGLLPVSMDNELGWNSNHPMNIHITSVLTPDETEPCIAIEFTNYPVMEYENHRHYS